MRILPALLATATFLSCRPAVAAPSQVSRVAISELGLPGVGATQASTALGRGEVVLGLGMEGDFSASGLRFTAPGSTAPQVPEDVSRLASRLALALGLGLGLEAAVSLPAYFESYSGSDGYLARARGMGDLTAALKAVLPWGAPMAGFSVLAFTVLPTSGEEGTFPRALIHHAPEGYPSASAHPFGTAHPRAGVGLGASLGPPASGREVFRLHLDVRGERHFAPVDESPLGLFSGGLAAEVPIRSGWSVRAEARREILMSEPRPEGTVGEGGWVSLGFAWSAPWGLAVSAGGRFGPEVLNPRITSSRNGLPIAYRAHPPASAWLQVDYQGFPLLWDRDGDKVLDRLDRCPRRPEDRDGFEDADGCPDIDNDRDGFTDAQDRCPASLEDRDGFRDWDGCPDPDNDLDKVMDGTDACANEAEDRDGHQDEDGCPDLDNDRDGIPDVADRCPLERETVNKFEDNDGCPEADGDRDGLPDKVDRCADEAEIVNFYQDSDGCPDAKPDPVRNGILPGIAFLSGSAELLPAAYPPLDSLARLMALYPGTEIEIQGHLDDRGGPGALELSEARARSVAEYLASKGIEPRRMRSVGFGGTRPIASNRTALGRETNRRIEIRRLN